MKEYPKFLTEGSSPFDPLELAQETEKIVCKNGSRKYTHFYCTGVYGGISTGYLVGCYLRCVFCWVEWSRDFPSQYGKFYTPQEVYQRLIANARKAGVNKLRISGGEPTIGREHLLGLLDLVNGTDYFFILETNGLLFGKDKRYIEALKKYRNLYVRVSLKAGEASGFQRRTGAQERFYDLPYLAIKNLKEVGIYFRVASMSDPRLMPEVEREAMIQKLREIGYTDYLEEERCDPYATSIARLKAAGFEVFRR